MLNEDYDQLLGIRQTKTVNRNILKFLLLIAHNYISGNPINIIINTGSIRNNDLIEILLNEIWNIYRHNWEGEPGENNKSIYTIEGTNNAIVQWHYIRPADFIPDITTCTLRNIIPIHSSEDYNILPKYATNFNEYIDFTDFQIYNSDEQGVDLEYNIDKYNTWDTYRRFCEVEEQLPNIKYNIINPYHTYFYDLTKQIMGIETNEDPLNDELEFMTTQRMTLFETYCFFHRDKLEKVTPEYIHEYKEYLIPTKKLLMRFIDEIDQSMPQYNNGLYLPNNNSTLPDKTKLQRKIDFKINEQQEYSAIQYLTNLKESYLTGEQEDGTTYGKPAFNSNIDWKEILKLNEWF